MKNYPFISILMPVRNEGAFMQRSLNAVRAQDYPSDRTEILVIDGMSTDNTRGIIMEIQACDSRVKLIDNPGRIVPTGLNAGLAVANGEVIVRVDGHCEIAADYVRRCVDHLKRDDLDAVGGPLDTVGETRMAMAIAVAMSSPFGVGGSAFRTVKGKSMLTDTVAFPAYKRSVVEKAGPFDEELVRNQDDEYNYRLRKLGAKILLAADVHCRYYSRSSLRLLARQYFQYGYWKVRVLQKHPGQMHPRQFVPFLFVLSLMTLMLASLFSGFARWALAIEVMLYVSANLLASILRARKGNGGRLIYLPAVFAALHLSYGFGFTAGLIKFRNRWRAAPPMKKATALPRLSGSTQG